MIRVARRQGKEFVHLGLGVNDGIRRFKSKWGGTPSLPYEMAEWQEEESLRGGERMADLICRSGEKLRSAATLVGKFFLRRAG